MARNRKRAKERRARRPQPAQVSRPGAASARPDLEEAPSPLEHAAPDAELADAQLAVGRPEPAPTSGMGPEAEPVDRAEAANGDESAAMEQEADEELEAEAVGAAAVRSGRGEVARIDGDRAAPEPRRVPGNRLVHFLQGSWHELQRVQWPDRRQVVQATGVVIGFVIVAGLFLGAADAVAGKLMDFILK